MNKLLSDLDHPVLFAVFITLTVLAMSSLLTFGADRWNIPGLKALAQHP